MAFGIESTNWQSIRPPSGRNRCSPNLRVVLAEVIRRWPSMTDLGCYGARPIRGGSAPSSHSYGAAIDIGYPPSFDPTVAAQVLPFLVARSEELHLGALHDYRRCRIWHAGRTPDPRDACTAWWKAQRPSTATGMGQSWCNHIHLEVTADGWSDQAPIHERWTE